MNPGSQTKTPPTRWRDLTDEERWRRIYDGRQALKPGEASSPDEAVALLVPALMLLRGFAVLRQSGADLREDVRHSAVTGFQRAASCLRQSDRDDALRRCEVVCDDADRLCPSVGPQEYCYATCHLLVLLADRGLYPADSPVTLAALSVKIDAEDDDPGDWKVNPGSARLAAEKLYESLLASGYLARNRC